MSSHIATVRAAIAHALPYVIPTIANRIAKQTAPIVVKEANHWAKRAGIDYRIVSSVTKHRRKLARLREERVNALFHFPKLVDAAKDKKGSCIVCGINPSMAAIWCDDYIKLKALCDQMGKEMEAAIPNLELHADAYFETLAAWKEMK